MRRLISVFGFVMFSILVAACADAGGEPASENRRTADSPQSAVSAQQTNALADITTPTMAQPTSTPEAPTSAATAESATSESAAVAPASGSDSVSPSVIPTSTSTPVPVLSTEVGNPGQVPAPKIIDHDGLTFFWEWNGLGLIGDEDWYFDIKIFYNAFAELPYHILVAEPESTQNLDGVWRFGGASAFECGSHWAVQIAERNADGYYAGPLSPESNRLPVRQGCPDDEDGDGGGNVDPCPGCG